MGHVAGSSFIIKIGLVLAIPLLQIGAAGDFVIMYISLLEYSCRKTWHGRQWYIKHALLSSFTQLKKWAVK